MNLENETENKKSLDLEVAELNEKVTYILEGMKTLGIVKNEPALKETISKESSPKEIVLEGQLECLKNKVSGYIKVSEDPLFTDYLHKMEKEININYNRFLSLDQDLSRAYSLYQQKREIGRESQSANQTQSELKWQPDHSAQSEQAPVSKQINQTFNYQDITDEDRANWQSTSQIQQPGRQQWQSERVKNTTAGNTRSQNTMEFKIGAGLLSVIGVLFVLVAFVTFGLDFLTGMLQGIFLFLISAAVLCISEFWIRRKHERFSICITGLGIASLYVSTIINYLYLHNFNELIAIILTLSIAGLALLISRKRDSAMIRIISFIGCYLCFFPANGFKSERELIAITIILFIINMVSIIYPVQTSEKKTPLADSGIGRRASNHMDERLTLIIHMACNTLFTVLLTAVAWSEGVAELYVIFYLMTAIIIANTIFYRLAKDEAVLILHCFQIAVYDLLILFILRNNSSILGTLILSFSISLLFFYLENGRREKWVHYYHFLLLSISCVLFSFNSTLMLWYILGAFVLVKLTAHYKETEALNCIVTVIAVMVGFTNYTSPESWLYFAAFFASLFVIQRFHYFHELTIMFFVAVLLSLKLDKSFLCAAAATFVLLLFLIPRIKCIREKNNNPVCYAIFSFLTLLYLILAFRNEPYEFAFMLLTGLVICFMFLRPLYGIRLKKNYIAISIFLTYMIFICKVELPIVISILLMLVAITSVGIGFWSNEKTIRRYGLFLSLFVCAKLVFYDFLEVESLQRILLFLVVGMIALGISFLYLYLEKKLKNNLEEERKI